MQTWPLHAARARRMGFDWIYLNPVHFPGFSGSCYAVKDPSRIDPLLLPAEHIDRHYDEKRRGDGGFGLLRETLHVLHAQGFRVMTDLVLNHTSRDALLVRQHPEWYGRDASGIRSPAVIDPADARHVTLWGDLAELDHAGPHRDAMWDHWEAHVCHELDLGFDGFRCDAAYKLPAALWTRLIQAARRRKPHVWFLAETLGARLEQVEALRDCGLDAFMNSSKYWAFDAPWCLEQQYDNVHSGIVSVSFPESHDTPRLWAETQGRVQVQKQRYAFAAAFASGVLMPIGFEFGFARALHVVETRPQDWEAPRVDLTAFIRRVHDVCREVPAFHGEHVAACGRLDAPTLVLERNGSRSAAFIAVNKDWHAGQVARLPDAARGKRAVRICRDGVPEVAADASIELDPAEVVYLID
jgi:starch synthase (maltosyl-transferring)